MAPGRAGTEIITFSLLTALPGVVIGGSLAYEPFTLGVFLLSCRRPVAPVKAATEVSTKPAAKI